MERKLDLGSALLVAIRNCDDQWIQELIESGAPIPELDDFIQFSRLDAKTIEMLFSFPLLITYTDLPTAIIRHIYTFI